MRTDVRGFGVGRGHGCGVFMRKEGRGVEGVEEQVSGNGSRSIFHLS